MGNFMTWEEWEHPNSQLKCLIESLICGTDCYKPVVSMSLANNGFITFTGPNGTLVFKNGGISTNTNNDIVLGTDGLPFFTEKITTIDSLQISGSNLSITYTNETGTPSSKSIPLVDICSACAGSTINPAIFISADANNAIVLGTDNKLFAPQASTTVVIPMTNAFTVTSGTSVTLTHTPLTTHHVQVYRNGARQRITDDYSRVGPVITFVTAFGDTLNSLGDGEEIIVDYFRV